MLCFSFCVSFQTKNVQGQTPLHLACQNGHLEVVESLINNGANLHSKDYFHVTPVMFAASGKHLNVRKSRIYYSTTSAVKRERELY